MDETLQKYGETVKNKEFQDLFPDTDPEKAREDEDKVKEALYQVYGIIWNPELYQHCEENPYITSKEIKKYAENKEQENRIRNGIGTVTVQEEDGEFQIPSRDVKYALTKRQELWD